MLRMHEPGKKRIHRRICTHVSDVLYFLKIRGLEFILDPDIGQGLNISHERQYAKLGNHSQAPRRRVGVAASEFLENHTGCAGLARAQVLVPPKARDLLMAEHEQVTRLACRVVTHHGGLDVHAWLVHGALRLSGHHRVIIQDLPRVFRRRPERSPPQTRCWGGAHTGRSLEKWGIG